MPENMMSPMLSTMINNQNQVQFQPKAPEPEVQPGVKEEKSSNKKLGVTLAAAMGVAALAAGAILIFKGRGDKAKTGHILSHIKEIQGKSASILDNSKTIQQEAQALQTRAHELIQNPEIQKSYNDIMALIKKGEASGWQKLEDEGVEFTTKIDETGKTVFQSLKQFTDGKLSKEARMEKERFFDYLVVDEYGDTGIRKLRFNSFGRCNQIGFSSSSDPKKLDELFEYCINKNLSSYGKNVEFLDDSVKYGKCYNFTTEGELYGYFENALEKMKDNGFQDTVKCDLCYYYNNGKLKDVYFDLDEENATKLGEYFVYDSEEGRLVAYVKDFQAQDYMYHDDMRYGIYLDKTSIGEHALFYEDGAQKYVQNQKITQDKYTCDMNVYLENGKIVQGIFDADVEVPRDDEGKLLEFDLLDILFGKK